MAYAVIADVGAQSATSNGVTTAAIDTTGANLIVVGIADYVLDSSTLTDSEGNTWAPLTAEVGTTDRAQLFYCFEPTTSATHTFTATSTVISYPAIAVIAFSGAVMNPFDQENGGSADAAESLNTGSATPSEDDEVLIALLSVGSGGGANSGIAIDDGFTLTDGIPYSPGAGIGIGFAYKIQTSAGAENPTFTWTTAMNSSAVIATFKSGAPSLAPTLATISPDNGDLDTVVPVTLTGTNLDQPFMGGDAEVAVSGTGVTVSNVVIVGATEITCDLTIDALATPGARTVTVETDEGTSNGLTFTINPPPSPFPQIEDTASSFSDTIVNDCVIDLPADIEAGELLMAFIRRGTTISGTMTWPAGWTPLVNAILGNGLTSLAYRIADGLEGATVTATAPGGSFTKFSALSWRISNHSGDAPEVSTPAEGTGYLPDPGELIPAGGAQDYLWLWIGGWFGEPASPPAGNPTNYELSVIGASTGTVGTVSSNNRAASAARELNAASQDPPSWAIEDTGVEGWGAITVAVAPLGGGGGSTGDLNDQGALVGHHTMGSGGAGIGWGF